VNETVFEIGLHSAILTCWPSLALIHGGKYACTLDRLLSNLLYFGTGWGYSRATTTILFDFELTTRPPKDLPLTGRDPWNTHTGSAQVFRGGVTDIPIFLTIFITYRFLEIRSSGLPINEEPLIKQAPDSSANLMVAALFLGTILVPLDVLTKMVFFVSPIMLPLMLLDIGEVLSKI
jgi:hypothetical protein